MEILFEDKDLLIVNKPGGLPAQQTKKEETSVISQLTQSQNHAILITHRLDQRATGAMILAKTKRTQAAINEQIKQGNMVKKYWAAVKEKPEKDKDTLIHYLLKDGKKNKSKAFIKQVAHSKRAELDFSLINKSDHYYLLEILLKTGRHHQIRAQLAAIGCPVKGDVKYGFKRTNSSNFIHLHACSLEFSHPSSGETITINATPPNDPLWNILVK